MSFVLIGAGLSVGGAVLGGPLGIGAMQGAQLGGKVGSYF